MKVQHIYYLLTSSRSFCIHIVFTINVIYYVSKVGLNPLQLVLLGTIMELAILIFEIPTGLVADFFGRKRSIVIGTFIIGFAHFLEGSFPTFWTIAISAALWGIGWTFISGAETAWIADELEKSKLDEVYIKGARYSSLGSFCGILFSVLLAIIINVQVAILIAGALLILIAFISLKIMTETKFIRISNGEKTSFYHMKLALNISLAQIKGNSILIGLAVITLFNGLASEGFDRLWGAHFIDTFHMNDGKTIYLFGVLYAISFLLNIGLLKLIETYLNGRFAVVLVIFNSFLIITILYFAINKVFLLSVIMYLIISSLRTVNYPLMSVMTNKELQSQGRATTLSMFGQLDALGQVAGGPLVGLIALYTSIQGGIVISAFLIFPTVYFLWKIRRIA